MDTSEVAQRILTALKAGDKSKGQLRELFGRNVPANQIDAALESVKPQWAMTTRTGRGRPQRVFHLVGEVNALSNAVSPKERGNDAVSPPSKSVQRRIAVQRGEIPEVIKTTADLENRLKRDRARKPAESEPSLSELMANLPQAGRDAIMEGARTGSPEPFQKWLRAWNKELAGRKTIPLGEALKR